MARHRRSRRVFTRRGDRREDTKRERAATRRALGGGHIRQPRSERWGHRPAPSLEGALDG